MLKLSSELFIEGPQLFLKYNKKKIGIIADTHIGYIRFLNKSGILIPDTQEEDMINSLSMINKNRLDTFVINGDFFHEFAKTDDETINTANHIIDFILKNISDHLIIIKGNHDKIIEKIITNKKVKISDKEIIGKYLITHGDIIQEIKKENIKNKTQEKKAEKPSFTIIGHEHPAIKLRTNTRSEDYKVYIKTKDIIVLPSFNETVEGHDITNNKFLSPYLKKIKLKDIDIYIIAKEKNKFSALSFGKLDKMLS